MHRIILLSLLSGLLAFSTGCNTMKGLGEDIQSLGNSIEGAAEDD